MGGTINFYTLENDYLKLKFTDVGGCLTESIKLSTNTNYLVKYHNLDDYLSNLYNLSAIIGRSAGRTSPCYKNHKGEIVYLHFNEGEHTHLHDGLNGMEKQKWQVRIVDNQLAYLRMNYKDDFYGEADFEVK